MIGLLGLCCVFMVITLILAIKIFLMRTSMEEIRREFSEKQKSDTNTLISVSSRDGAICRLANDINIQLRKLRRQQHRFRQGDTEVKNAIANISHDLRTPLTSICGYLDLLEQETLSEDARRHVSVIRNRTEVLTQLTEELFGYSLILNVERNASRQPVVINGVLEESIASFYTSLHERGIIPVIDMPEQKVVRNLNISALTRVFSNLMNNAIKYSDRDLEITLSEAGEIIFANTASGLNEVQVGKLFDRFYTVEAARKSTGLGLAIARTLIEQMDGTISAEYEKDQLRICIFFPDDTVVS